MLSFTAADRFRLLFVATLSFAAAAGAAARKPPDPSTLPECHDAAPLSNTHVNVVITAGASEGGTWTVTPSTSAVAGRFLQLVNENSRAITFIPVNADKADYVIAVAVDESTGDARVDVVSTAQADAQAALASSGTVVTSVIESTGAEKTVRAAALITSPRKDPTLRITVPAAAETYTEWDDALDRVSADVLTVFAKGWHTDPPCRRADGTLKLK